MGLQGGGGGVGRGPPTRVYPKKTVSFKRTVCLSTDKTCALKVKRINYPASGTSRKGKSLYERAKTKSRDKVLKHTTLLVLLSTFTRNKASKMDEDIIISSIST